MKKVTTLLLVAAWLALSSSSCEKPKEDWIKALEDCGLTDINSKKILYFGPSNNVGPGSVWRETFDQNAKHVDYRLRFSEDELPPPKNFVQPAGANSYQCKGGRTVSFKLSADVSASVGTIPLNVEVSNDLKRAKNVTISVGGMAWDQLRELAYEDYFKKTLGAGNPYYEDTNIPNRFVLYRALAVKDLVMTYDFSISDAATIKAKYKGPLGGLGPGDIGGGLSADWKSDTSLTITAPQKAWVLGEIASFRSASGFAGRKAGAPLQPIDIPANTPIVVEKLQ